MKINYVAVKAGKVWEIYKHVIVNEYSQRVITAPEFKTKKAAKKYIKYLEKGNRYK